MDAVLKQRKAGSLLHLSSLPSETGIGNLGDSAYSFVDFLAKSGNSFWQLCPVGPTGFGDSPYQVFSSSAGNSYFIDWEPLVEKKLIRGNDLQPLYDLPRSEVDYGKLYSAFLPAAKFVSENFFKDLSSLESSYGCFRDFTNRNKSWLEPYCLFQTLKNHYNQDPWWNWPEEHTSLLEDFKECENYRMHQFLQYVFRGQWKKLKDFAAKRRVSLIGDLPIYCAPDSAEVWHSPHLFQVDPHHSFFENVAGVPPDYFNEDGQYWGNPLYDWPIHQADEFSWWMDRLKIQLELFDLVRIDHFRGFNDYWSIPAKEQSAKAGKWIQGPGIKFWQTAQKAFPSLPFLAEDLGLITDQVRKLREQAGLMGMAVLQFAFDGDPGNLYLPHNLTSSLALYTGTHDNDTTNGWYESSSAEIKDNFRSYLNAPGHEPSWEMLRTAYRTVSPLVISPVQDYLGLGSEARLNQPGVPQGNWKWRLSYDQLGHLSSSCSSYLREQLKITGRLPARSDSISSLKRSDTSNE